MDPLGGPVLVPYKLPTCTSTVPSSRSGLCTFAIVLRNHRSGTRKANHPCRRHVRIRSHDIFGFADELPNTPRYTQTHKSTQVSLVINTCVYRHGLQPPDTPRYTHSPRGDSDAATRGHLAIAFRPRARQCDRDREHWRAFLTITIAIGATISASTQLK